MAIIPTALIGPLFNPATFSAPAEIDRIMTEVRRDYPLAIAEVPGFDPHWIVSRHADIQEISRQNERFHNGDRSATSSQALCICALRLLPRPTHLFFFEEQAVLRAAWQLRSRRAVMLRGDLHNLRQSAARFTR